MSGKAAALKMSFHDACTRAVKSQLGSGWRKVELGSDSWTARFQRSTKVATRVLSLRLADKRHEVEVLLAIKLAPDDPMPRIWWEDRAMYPDQTGYVKVLWSGPAYGSEQSIAVPRESWSVEFGRAIEKQLASLRPAVERWYAEAESMASS